MQVRRVLFSLILFAVFSGAQVSGSLNVSVSDQGTDVRESGVLLQSGNLTVQLWDNLSGGTNLYNVTFANAISNGSWNILLNLSLEYGRVYYKDYQINGVDLDFNGEERLIWYSSLGDVSGEDVRNDSLGGNVVNESQLNCSEIVGSDGVCGVNTVSSGVSSTALGEGTSSTGWYSTAMGRNTNASADYSTAFGGWTTSSALYAMATGYNTTASGKWSTALGHSTASSGWYSIATGKGIEASGSYSVGIALNDQTGSNLTQSSTMAIMGGKVGIDTLAPLAPLHVSDYMMIEPRSSAPSSPSEGFIYYDTTLNVLRIYDGLSWLSVISDGTSWGGDLGGSGASPTVDDDSHQHNLANITSTGNLDTDSTNDWTTSGGIPLSNVSFTDQNLATTNQVTFHNITATVKVTATEFVIGANSLTTAEWANLDGIDQAVSTGSAVTFATVNTGQGANELYDMDQNVQTTNTVTFAGVVSSNNVNASAFYQGGTALDSLYVSRDAWTDIDSYPTACTNQFVTGLADTLSCASVAAAHMADADHGDVAWTTGVATVQNLQCSECVTNTELADTDYTDFTCLNGACTLDADVVAAAEMADADHGDVAWTTGVASVENVQCSGSCISDAEVDDTITVGSSGSVNNAALPATISKTNLVASGDVNSTSIYKNGQVVLTYADVLGDANVSDTITASNYVRTSTWTDINSYPTACTNQFVTGLADTLSCASVAAAHMADADHGDVAWTTGTATVQNLQCTGCVAAAELATADFVDFSCSAGSCTLDADVVAAAEMADADHGDVAWSSGVASVENVQCGTSCIADAEVDNDITIASSSALSAATVDTGQGANELYDMDQNVQTTNVVRFVTVLLTSTDTPTTCDGTTQGGIYHDTSMNEICFCNASSWNQVDGGGACT
ncbi:MAG: hypothetical protein V1921_05845 [Candidatus Altiarchaeota archaeon]